MDSCYSARSIFTIYLSLRYFGGGWRRRGHFQLTPPHQEEHPEAEEEDRERAIVGQREAEVARVGVGRVGRPYEIEREAAIAVEQAVEREKASHRGFLSIEENVCRD